MPHSLLFATVHRPYILLLALTLLVWLGSFHGNTIGIDTYWLVESNVILREISIENIRKIFFDFSLGTRLTLGSEYLPIRDLSVMLDLSLFGENWLMHRLHSVVLYLISGLFLLNIAFSIFGKNSLTWLAIFCYMVHPTHVESVVWLASRKDVLSLLLGLIGFWSYVKNKKTLLPTLFFILAYWAKNTAIVFPPILVFYSILIEKASPLQARWWKKWPLMVFCFVSALSISMKTGELVRIFGARRGENLLEGLSISAQSWWSYVEMVGFPVRLSIFYAEPSPALNIPTILGISAALSLSIGIIAGLWKRYFLFVFCLLWMVFSFLPVSQLIPLQNLIADRYLLLPSIGFCFVLAIPWKPSLQQKLLLIWGLFLSFLTVERCTLFQSSLDLWYDTTKKQPQDVRGWSITIGTLIEEGRTEEAEPVLQEALQLHPDHPSILQAQGNLALENNQLELAKDAFLKAWKGDYTLRKSANNLCIIYQRENQLDKARAIAEDLVHVHPLYPNGWNSLGAIGIASRDLELASKALHRSHELNPYSTSNLSNLGDLYYLEQDWNKAAHFWNQTLLYDPSNQHARQGLDVLREKRAR